MRTTYVILLVSSLFGCASSQPYIAPEPPAYVEHRSTAPPVETYGGAEDDYGGRRAVRATAGEAESAEGGRGFFDFFDLSLGGGATRPEGARVAQAPAAPPAPPAPPPPDAPAEPEPEPTVVDDRASAKRLLIYRATYNVMVANVDDSVKKLVARAESMGGYLQSRADGTVTVRVPAARFFELTGELGDFGLITNESLEALDVTKQYVDLSLRLDTAEKSRARLVKLLEQATKMEDILRIENELRRLTEEIETMKGELRLLADQIAFSTLTVRFFSDAPPPSRPSKRRQSRFPWINAVGIEQVMYGF